MGRQQLYIVLKLFGSLIATVDHSLDLELFMYLQVKDKLSLDFQWFSIKLLTKPPLLNLVSYNFHVRDKLHFVEVLTGVSIFLQEIFFSFN